MAPKRSTPQGGVKGAKPAATVSSPEHKGAKPAAKGVVGSEQHSQSFLGFCLFVGQGDEFFMERAVNLLYCLIFPSSNISISAFVSSFLRREVKRLSGDMQKTLMSLEPKPLKRAILI